MNACATTATPTVVASTRPIASSPIGRDVRAQVAKGREEGRAVEERREHAEEDELRLELELRHPRDEADREAAEDEQDRVRDPKRRRDREHRRDGEDQPERDERRPGARGASP